MGAAAIIGSLVIPAAKALAPLVLQIIGGIKNKDDRIQAAYVPVLLAEDLSRQVATDLADIIEEGELWLNETQPEARKDPEILIIKLIEGCKSVQKFSTKAVIYSDIAGDVIRGEDDDKKN